MAEDKKQEQATKPQDREPQNQAPQNQAPQNREPGDQEAGSPVDLSDEPLVDLSDVGQSGKLSPDEDPVALLEAEAASLKDQLLRAMAETENVRRRAQREREDTVKYAAVPVIKDLLGVADNLQRALESVPEDLAAENEQVKNLRLGVEMTRKELQAVFERHAIRPINPLGEKLDPHLHEAMYEVDDPTKPAGTVVQVIQSGYRLHDRLLRPARVGISKGGPRGAPADPAGEGEAPKPGDPKPGDRVDTQA